MSGSIFKQDFDFYNNLPPVNTLFNPLIDRNILHKEDNEMVEFYKLCNEYFSPEFGIKYLLNINLFPYQMATIRAILMHRFPLLLITRGGAKSFMLAVAAVYYAVMFPGSKIVIVSATLRQAKGVFNYIIKIYKNSPILQLISNHEPRISNDRCYYTVNESTIVALPLGQGEKIRGERGNFIIADEFDGIPTTVFDIVVRGFGATAADPYNKVKSELVKRRNIIVEPENDNKLISEGNKIVLAGTAGFKGGPLYRMYRQYSSIINNKLSGQAKDFNDLLGEEISSEEDIEIDHKDYCIIRYNYLEIPKGMMELKMIHSARATMPKIIFDMEYNTLFADDNTGFFKVKQLNDATSKYPGGFAALHQGSAGKQYIMGVDPARTSDRFAICLIEAGSPSKIVFAWTCQNKKFSEATAKIRDLIRKFNVIGIGMDSQGGGYAVAELLQSKELMNQGDKLIYSFDSEIGEGSKILHMYNFSSVWIEEANASLQKNIEDKNIMFPMEINPFAEQIEAVDESIEEIRELKKELASIEITYTKSGRKHFDLMPPDVKKGEDVVRHKDRYSALLLANYLLGEIYKMDAKTEALIKYQSATSTGGWLEEF